MESEQILETKQTRVQTKRRQNPHACLVVSKTFLLYYNKTRVLIHPPPRTASLSIPTPLLLKAAIAMVYTVNGVRPVSVVLTLVRPWIRISFALLSKTSLLPLRSAVYVRR